MTEVRVRKPFRHSRTDAVPAQSLRDDTLESLDEENAEVIVHSEEETRSEAIKLKMLDKTPQKLKNPSNLQVRIRTGTI